MGWLRATLVYGVSAILLAALISQAAFAKPSTDLKIMIFPLECSIDLLNTGVRTFRRITPENCQDPDEEPGIPGGADSTIEQPTLLSPPASPLSSTPQYIGLASSLEQMPLTALLNSPEVKKTAISDYMHDDMKSLPAAAGPIGIMTLIIIAIPAVVLLSSIINAFIGRIKRDESK